ncbi:MAG: IS66-like element accessory protein TnpA [Bradyrhizobium sp.]
MADGTIEIITGKERRRRWSAEEKLRIVTESHEPGACVTAVAARHDVYPSLVFAWRRQFREGQLQLPALPGFVPVRLLGSAQRTDPQPPCSAASDAGVSATIEIALPDGIRLHVSHATQLPLLRGVIAALRG